MIALSSLVTVLALTAPAAQENIPLATLTRIKACTVFVKVKMGPIEATGSGFVIKVDGDSAYIATNHHVVNPRVRVKGTKPVLTLVFESGTRTEQVVEGEVLASDSSRDLAVVKVTGVKRMPQPIDLSAQPQLVETMPVFTFGYPFGRMLSTSHGSPAITVGRGTVSSIRKDDAGDVALVQIDGALNPGNSGGPVVSAEGSLIGIAVATIRGAQQIGLVIPHDQLVMMLDGRVGSSTVRTRSFTEKKADLEIEVDLIDPLKRIKDVAFLYAPGDVRPIGETPISHRGYEPLADSMRLPLAVAGSKAAGTLQLSVPSSAGQRLTFQIAYRNGTGQSVHLQPVVHRLSVQSIASRPDSGTAKPSGPTASRPTIRLSPSRPLPAFGRQGKLEPFLSLVVDPRAKVVFTATPSGFLKRYSYPGFELQGSFKLPGPATQLVLDASRGRLFAVVTTARQLRFNHPSHQPSGVGDLHVYDVGAILKGGDAAITELTPASTLHLGTSVSRMILSADGQFLYLLEILSDAKNPPARLVRVDTSKNVADLELDLEQGAEALCLGPGGKPLYVAVSPRGHTYYGTDGAEEGKIYMVDPESFEVQKTALIELDPADIQADDHGQVYLSGGSNQHTMIAVVDMSKTRAIIARWKGVYMGASIRLTSDQKRLYVGSRNISPASVSIWALPDDPAGVPGITRLQTGLDAPLGGEIFLTPDDAFLLTRFGAVVPLGQGKGADDSPSPSKSSTPRPRKLIPSR